MKRIASTLRGPRALFGATGALVSFFRNPARQLFALHDSYGSLAALADRNAAIVCAFGAEANHTVLSDPDGFQHHADLPFEVPEDSAPRRLHTSLTSMNGELHRSRRRALQPLFSRAAVDGYRDAMATEIAARVPAVGEAGDAVPRLGELALAIAMRCLFGVPATAELARLAVAYLERLTDPFAIAIPVALPGTPRGRLFATARALEAGIRALLDERRRSPGGDDVLARLLDLPEMNDDERIGQATLMFVASYETTASTLAWTLLLLSQHPEELAGLHDELAPLAGRVPTLDELAKLHRLDAVVRESMRLVPATPFLFLRRVAAPTRVLGHELARDALVLLSPLVTHRDPAQFRDPERFMPARWQASSPSPYAYLPFGAGPRLCLGASFARQAIRLALAALLSRAHPQLASPRLHPGVRGIILGLDELPLAWVAPGRVGRVPAQGLDDLRLAL